LIKNSISIPLGKENLINNKTNELLRDDERLLLLFSRSWSIFKTRDDIFEEKKMEMELFKK
jgi:hypothetical protein